MLIFYSLGNFVSTQESFDALLEGMGCFTIQKTVKDGQTSIEIIDPQIKPMVMHYNKDAGVFSPYMLSDYTEELASQHELRTVLGDDSFTLANLQNRFKEIMSLTVKPSSNTDLLDVTFNSDGDMVNSNGEYVDDTWSVSAANAQDDTAADNSDSSDDSSDSSDDSSDSSDDYDYSDSSDDSDGSDYSDESDYSDDSDYSDYSEE